MATATVSRDSTGVDIPLLESSAGSPLVAVDVGKPNQEFQPTGNVNPRHADHFSGIEQYSLIGRFLGSDAYSDAIELADLIKSNADGTPLSLSIDLPEFDDVIVAPAAGQDAALGLTYPPGQRQWVELDFALTRISRLSGSYEQPASTPTDTGSGPIQLSYAGHTVDLKRDVTVERSVGRPGSTVRRSAADRHPFFVDRHKTAHDAFEISTEFSDSSYLTDTQELLAMFSKPMGRETMTLSFNGLYGLGDFAVAPSGSGALRHNRVAAEEGTKLLPSINLRRVQE